MQKEEKAKKIGYSCMNPTPRTRILHPILHPKLSVNKRPLVFWCRKCRRFSKTFFCGGQSETANRKVQNIGLLWAKVRMFCSKSTDVFIEKVRCFYFPERELHNLNAVFKPFRGHIHHVQLYIKNMVFLLFRETWMPLMVHQLLELSNRCCPFTIDAVPVAII